MVKKVHEMMALRGEDESSHMLTQVYRKYLDLKREKIKANSRQTILRDFITPASKAATETIDSDNMLSDYDDY